MSRSVAAFACLLALSACGAPAARQGAGAACGLPAAQMGVFMTMPAGDFVMGADPRYPEEGPGLRVHVDAFAIQAHEVTNDQFAAFVAATGHVTDAERPAPNGGSAVFSSDLRQWRLDRGATWRTPEGADSSIAGRGAMPVVHVSHADAQAYARWAGARLPSEVEWEYAAARQLPDPADQRSGAYDGAGAPVANTWQGVFPIKDDGEDGFRAPAPVGCFPAGATGLYDMIGNVWEWTDTPYAEGAQFTIKGGSYLCAKNFCGRFRPAARQPQDADFSTGHIGFRVVKDAR